MPWLIVVKKVFGGVAKLLPLKVWIAIGILIGAYFSIKYYGNIQYAEGVHDTQQEYKKAEEKALNEDLRKLKEELKVATDQLEKARRINSETASEVEKNADRAKQLEEEIKALKYSKDDACNKLSDDEFGLLNRILKQTPTE